jgi:hypothetical protein
LHNSKRKLRCSRNLKTTYRDTEIIADKLHEAGWSLGCVSAIDSSGRTIWIVDAHRDNGKGFRGAGR